MKSDEILLPGSGKFYNKKTEILYELYFWRDEIKFVSD
jgi:hypothetical protein